MFVSCFHPTFLLAFAQEFLMMLALLVQGVTVF